MNKYLPSKKFILIIFSLILASAIVITTNWWLDKDSEIKTSNPAVLSATTTAKMQEFLVLDTDQDGLKDWEEALYKTDPKKADTDGDGTTDSAELQADRDPLKKNTALAGQAPNDKVDADLVANEKKAEEEFKQLTATERLSRELFSQYIATKKVGAELSDSDIMQIVNNSLTNLPAFTFQTYTVKDLKIINDNSNQVLATYANNLASLFFDFSRTATPVDLEKIFSQLSDSTSDANLTKETETALSQLDPVIFNNRQTIQKIILLSVPTELTNEHLNLLNALEMTTQSLEIMRRSASDFLNVVIIMTGYEQIVNNLKENFINLAQKLASLNIKYDDELDYGNQFFNVIILNK